MSSQAVEHWRRRHMHTEYGIPCHWSVGYGIPLLPNCANRNGNMKPYIYIYLPGYPIIGKYLKTPEPLPRRAQRNQVNPPSLPSPPLHQKQKYWNIWKTPPRSYSPQSVQDALQFRGVVVPISRLPCHLLLLHASPTRIQLGPHALQI